MFIYGEQCGNMGHEGSTGIVKITQGRQPREIIRKRSNTLAYVKNHQTVYNLNFLGRRAEVELSSNSSHQTIKNFLQQFQQTDTTLSRSINLSRSSFRRSSLCNLVETSSNERKIFNYGNRGIKFNRWPVLSSFRETFVESRNLLIGPRLEQRRNVRRETKDWNKEDEKNRIKSLLCRILLLSCLVIIFHLVSSCRIVSF